MDAKMMADGVRALVVKHHLGITHAAELVGVSRSSYQRIMRGERDISPLEFRSFCQGCGEKMRDALALGAEL
jgi:hypothetical protein